MEKFIYIKLATLLMLISLQLCTNDSSKTDQLKYDFDVKSYFDDAIEIGIELKGEYFKPFVKNKYLYYLIGENDCSSCLLEIDFIKEHKSNFKVIFIGELNSRSRYYINNLKIIDYDLDDSILSVSSLSEVFPENKKLMMTPLKVKVDSLGKIESITKSLMDNQILRKYYVDTYINNYE